ncbi:MAG: CsgG/HfaB family protein [Phycisphaerae bacterium]|jgi:hypothetical protein|nr:CsgG/HfaB family protein [Phycisphaerae bacterium]
MNTIATSLKRATALAAMSLLVLSGSGCEPQTSLRYSGKLLTVKTMAVLPFQDAPGSHARGSGRIVVNGVIGQLYELPGVRIVERSRLATILKEKDFRGTLDPSKATTIGKLAGADMVIFGDVTQYDAQQNYGHVGVAIISGGETKYTHRVGLSIRGVSVDDGRVIYARSGQGADREGYTKAAEIAAERAIKPLQLFYKQKRGQ